MSADQIDEIAPNSGGAKQNSSNLVPALIAIILAPLLTVVAMSFVIKMNKPDSPVSNQITEEANPSIWSLREKRNFMRLNNSLPT